MATLLENILACTQEYRTAQADGEIDRRESLRIGGQVAHAVGDFLKLASEPSQEDEAVRQAREVYDYFVTADNIDIPRLPEAAERWVLNMLRPIVQPAVERVLGWVTGGA